MDIILNSAKRWQSQYLNPVISDSKALLTTDTWEVGKAEQASHGLLKHHDPEDHRVTETKQPGVRGTPRILILTSFTD